LHTNERRCRVEHEAQLVSDDELQEAHIGASCPLTVERRIELLLRPRALVR
jgi:hypothetical protein